MVREIVLRFFYRDATSTASIATIPRQFLSAITADIALQVAQQVPSLNNKTKWFGIEQNALFVISA